MLDLSLRRRVTDDVIAAVLRLQPEEVAPRREAALDRLAWDLGIYDQGKRAKLPEELAGLPEDQWPSDFDAPTESSQDSPNVEAPAPADEPPPPAGAQPPVLGEATSPTPGYEPAADSPLPAPTHEPPAPAADTPTPAPGYEPPAPVADAPASVPGYGPPWGAPPYEPPAPGGSGSASDPVADATLGPPPASPESPADASPGPAADAATAQPAEAAPAPTAATGLTASAPPGGPPGAGRPAGGEARRRRRGGAWLVMLAGALIGAVLGLVLFGGSDDDGKSDSPSAPPAHGTRAPKPRALEALVEGFPGHGTAAIEGTGTNRRLKVSLRDLPPREEAYAVWLYNTIGDARLLDSAVGTSLNMDKPLPADADRYRFVDVSREPIDENSNHSGASVLRIPIADLSATGQP